MLLLLSAEPIKTPTKVSFDDKLEENFDSSMTKEFLLEKVSYIVYQYHCGICSMSFAGVDLAVLVS